MMRREFGKYIVADPEICPRNNGAMEQWEMGF